MGCGYRDRQRRGSGCGLYFTIGAIRFHIHGRGLRLNLSRWRRSWQGHGHLSTHRFEGYLARHLCGHVQESRMGRRHGRHVVGMALGHFLHDPLRDRRIWRHSGMGVHGVFRAF